jgi:hypothetical protein
MRENDPKPLWGALSFNDWISVGIASGWCGPVVCATHDGTPSSESEDAELIEGMDPCQHIIRVYEDNEMKAAVESYYQPYKWRRDPAEETDPRDK